MKRMSFLTIITVLTVVLIFGSVYGLAKKENAPMKIEDQFYNETRLIMLKEEARIYKHLPDEKARETFIEDFWKKRDPSPGTPENENRMEFERRLAYINRWFKEKTGRDGSLDTDRGKVYLLLGDPDERSNQQVSVVDRFGLPKRVLAEIWTYSYHRLQLFFVDADGLGRYRLNDWNVDVLAAIDRAKFDIQAAKKDEKPLKFTAEVKNKELKLEVPVSTVSFAENENTMNARFKVNLYIYKDYQKVNQLEDTKEISKTKNDLLNQKNLEFTIPLNVDSGGKYLLDIVLEELDSGATYRDMITYKY